MKEALQFYIDGQWVAPVQPKAFDVINPATEEPIGRITSGQRRGRRQGRGRGAGARSRPSARPPARSASRCSNA